MLRLLKCFFEKLMQYKVRIRTSWMSITPLHLTAARLRIWMKVKSSVWAAAGDRQALAENFPESHFLAYKVLIFIRHILCSL